MYLILAYIKRFKIVIAKMCEMKIGSGTFGLIVCVCVVSQSQAQKIYDE